VPKKNVSRRNVKSKQGNSKRSRSASVSFKKRKTARRRHKLSSKSE